MGNHAESPKQTVVVEKVLHKQLKDDNMPVLKVDLDGNGKNIKNVADVECVTVNGQDPFKVFAEGLKNLLKQCQAELAKKEHTHSEFTVLRADIDNLAKTTQPKGDYAEVSHTHDISVMAGILPLSKVRDGDKLMKLVSSSFADKDHRHPELEARLKEPSQAIEDLLSALEKKQDKKDADLAILAVKKQLSDLEKLVSLVQNSIPKPVEEEYEYVASQVFIVPRKANGMKVVELATYSTDGMRIKAEVPLKVGDQLSYDAFYKLPADTIVRIRVK